MNLVRPMQPVGRACLNCRPTRSWRKRSIRQAAPKVWNYLKYRTQKRHAVVKVSRSTPQIASLLLTKRCNLSCDFCNVASFLHDKSTKWRKLEGDLERVKKIFENPLFASCLLVDILGGQPLMVKELVPIVAFLTKRGHLTNITTNGMRLLPRIAELRDAGISRICVSIYEDNRAILERDLAKINAIFPVNTSLILFRKDVENAPDMLIERARFLRDSGCLDVRFWMYRPIGEGANAGEILFEDDACFQWFKARMNEALPGFCFWPTIAKKGPVKKLCPSFGSALAVICPAGWESAAAPTCCCRAPKGISSRAIPPPSTTTPSLWRCASNFSIRTRSRPRCARHATSSASQAGSAPGSVFRLEVEVAVWRITDLESVQLAIRRDVAAAISAVGEELHDFLRGETKALAMDVDDLDQDPRPAAREQILRPPQ